MNKEILNLDYQFIMGKLKPLVHVQVSKESMITDEYDANTKAFLSYVVELISTAKTIENASIELISKSNTKSTESISKSKSKSIWKSKPKSTKSISKPISKSNQKLNQEINNELNQYHPELNEKTNNNNNNTTPFTQIASDKITKEELDIFLSSNPPLDLEDNIIEKLLENDKYFQEQVEETIHLLTEKGKSG